MTKRQQTMKLSKLNSSTDLTFQHKYKLSKLLAIMYYHLSCIKVPWLYVKTYLILKLFMMKEYIKLCEDISKDTIENLVSDLNRQSFEERLIDLLHLTVGAVAPVVFCHGI